MKTAPLAAASWSCAYVVCVRRIVRKSRRDRISTGATSAGIYMHHQTPFASRGQSDVVLHMVRRRVDQGREFGVSHGGVGTDPMADKLVIHHWTMSLAGYRDLLKLYWAGTPVRAAHISEHLCEHPSGCWTPTSGPGAKMTAMYCQQHTSEFLALSCNPWRTAI